MSFRSPFLLWLLAAVPLVFSFFLIQERRRARLARRFVSERLRGVTNPLRPARPYLLTLAFAAASLALAGPRFGFTTVPIQQREAYRVIAIDLSLSMAARDVGTSRLDAAKAIAKRIIESNPGRIGLIVFETEAQVVSPLTSDGDAVSALLDSVEPGELSEPGTDLSAALTAASQLMIGEPGQKGDIVIISDGEDQGGSTEKAIRPLKERGIPVTTILVGTGEGSTIPMPGGRGPLRDESGQVVVTYARPDALELIARQTGGHFYQNPFAEHALDALAASLQGGKVQPRAVRVPIDRYQWPLAFAFAVILCGSLAHRGAE